MTNNKDNYVLKGGVSKNRIDTESILNNLSEGSEIALDLVEGLGKSNNIELLANGYEEEINNLKQKEIYKKLEKEKKELEIERIKQEEKLLKQQQREIKKIYNALDNRRTDITKIDTGNRRKSKTEFREEDNKTEPIIKKRNNTEDEKINRRAEILYGNAEYNQYWKDVNNKTKKQDIGEITNQPEIKPLPDISNPEKMFFKNGTLADMPVAKQYDLTKYNQKNNKEILSSEQVEEIIKNFSDYEAFYEYVIDNIDNQSLRLTLSIWPGYEAAEFLYMSKSDSYLNTSYANKHLVYNNYHDVSSELQPIIKEKIIKSLGKDKLEITKGIYVAADSSSSKKIAKKLLENKKFIEIYSKNKTKIKNGLHVDSSEMIFKDSNFKNALQKVDIKDMHINKRGDIDLLVIDIYDFNKKSSNPLVKVAAKKQEQGEIIPYFIIFHVIIPKLQIQKMGKQWIKIN